MWQTEDLLRAAGCDADRLRTSYLSQFHKSEEEMKELEQWYLELIDMMRSEHVVDKGHLQINKNIIIWLSDLHAQLLQSPKQQNYHAAYYKALPFITELRARTSDPDISDIELCFNALYGVMLLRLQKKEITEQTATAVTHITALLRALSTCYKEDKEGSLEL